MCSVEIPGQKQDGHYVLCKDVHEPEQPSNRMYLLHLILHVFVGLICTGFIIAMIHKDVLRIEFMDPFPKAVLLLIIGFTGIVICSHLFWFVHNIHQIVTTGVVDDDLKQDYDDVKRHWVRILLYFFLTGVFVFSVTMIAKADSGDVLICVSMVDCQRVAGNFSVLSLVSIVAMFLNAFHTPHPE